MEHDIKNFITGALYTVDGKKICDLTDGKIINEDVPDLGPILIRCSQCRKNRVVPKYKWEMTDGPEGAGKYYLCKTCDEVTLFREVK